MINENGETLIEHHTKYKELHGVDETVWMTDSEHKKLHFKLRSKGKCNVPVAKLTKISIAAHARTKKRIKSRIEYTKKNMQSIEFFESMGANVQFIERITLNHATDNVSCYAWFLGTHGNKLPIINI